MVLLAAQVEWLLKGHTSLPLNNAKQMEQWDSIFQDNLDLMGELGEEGKGIVKLKVP